MKKLAIILLFVVLALCLALVGIRQSRLRIPQRQFDSVLWSSDRPGNPGDRAAVSDRQRMVSDLVGSVLPGKGKQQIYDLLGPPDGYVYIGPASADRLRYYLGIERIFIYDHRGVAGSADPEELVIFLDGDGMYRGWFIDGSRRWRSIVDARARSYLIDHPTDNR